MREEELDPYEEAERQLGLPMTELEAELVRIRTEAIQARSTSGVETRWREDTDAYHGSEFGRGNFVEQAAARDSPSVIRGNKPDQQPKRATVFVQLTRQKTNTAAARLGDMLVPTDDRNWVLLPSPIPELAAALEQNPDEPITHPQTGQPLPHPDKPGQVLTVRDHVTEQYRMAEQRARAMQKVIDDRLVECRYNATIRQVIADAAKLGTGIVKGPHVVNRTRRAWVKDGSGRFVQKVVEARKPISVRVNPWNVYVDPACGDDHQNGNYIWEVTRMSRREVRRLGRSRHYRKEAIEEALRQGPQSSVVSHERRSPEEYDRDAQDKHQFEVWTFVGELAAHDLVANGGDYKGDILDSVKAVVVMINDRIVRIMTDPLDLGDFNYDFFRWERIDDSPYGVGIPYLMRYAQKTLNAAWRAMLDNMAVSYGPQVVVNRNAVVPVNGSWEIHGRKLWELKEPLDIDKVFKVFNIESNQNELQRIVELSMKFADEETSLPMIAQGEQGTAPDRVGVVQILMNAANVVTRRLAKEFDDNITRPHITRYYDYEMLMNEDESIKGDYEVDARGSTELVVRDAQKQELIELLQMADHPLYRKYVDPKELFRKVLEAKRLPNVMKSENEIRLAESQPEPAPPPDPRIAAAQIKAQADVRAIEIETQSEAENIRLRAEDAQEDRRARIYELQLKRELALMDYANKRDLTLEQVKAKLTDTVIRTNSAERIKAADLAAQGRTKAAERKLDEAREA